MHDDVHPARSSGRPAAAAPAAQPPAMPAWPPTPGDPPTGGRSPRSVDLPRSDGRPPSDGPATVDVAAMERLATQLLDRTPGTYEQRVKPVVDRVVAAAALLLLGPVLLGVALAVRRSVGSPILYGQRRAGLGGEPFTMLKFRTMDTDRRDDAAQHDRRAARDRPWPWLDRRTGDRRRTHKTADDPRHTPVGRLLRRTSLDELPQLVHVLRGEMSLVGPRPELHRLTEGYTSWQRARHLVRPGVTGLWQTTRRGDGLLLGECIDLDLRYIDRLSARTDLAILLRTPLALLRTRNII